MTVNRINPHGVHNQGRQELRDTEIASLIKQIGINNLAKKKEENQDPLDKKFYELATIVNGAPDNYETMTREEARTHIEHNCNNTIVWRIANPTNKNN